jgi:hypothetical protein
LPATPLHASPLPRRRLLHRRLQHRVLLLHRRVVVLLPLRVVVLLPLRVVLPHGRVLLPHRRVLHCHVLRRRVLLHRRCGRRAARCARVLLPGVYNKHTIACTYLRGWFVIDLLSVVPFWMLTLDYADPMGVRSAINSSATDAVDTGNPFIDSGGAELFRVVRLLRMLKLARVLKASRILQRHLLELVMGTLEMTYAKVKMVKLVLLLVLWSHWQACLWGLVSSFMADANKPNWLSTFRAGFFVTNGHTPTAYDEYSAALYWSVMTLTSIGYGEFTAVNTPERFLGSLYMLCSGVIWTYAIGSVASIATTLDPNGVLFHNTMDSLNYFMRERGLPIPMRITLREYFQQARRVHQVPPPPRRPSASARSRRPSRPQAARPLPLPHHRINASPHHRAAVDALLDAPPPAVG